MPTISPVEKQQQQQTKFLKTFFVSPYFSGVLKENLWRERALQKFKRIIDVCDPYHHHHFP
jgi:hypothetical protein